jgi:hypothetical protein
VPRPWLDKVGAALPTDEPIAERRVAGSADNARLIYGAAAILAGAVLADSAVEHYRGSFRNPAMYVALAAAAGSLAASGGAMAPQAAGAGTRPERRALFAAATAAGIIGTGFHVFNLAKRPGGISWLDLFYGAPIGAPAALSLSGVLGLAADRIDGAGAGAAPTLAGLPPGRALAALAGVGIFGTAAEAGLLHFRGAFHNPVMYLPVSVPPLAAGLMAAAALRPSRRRHRLTRFWLAATGILGGVGPAFHAYGVSRAMGGWRNWRQTVIDGPPIPAPPSFAALALAGLAALRLIEGAGG